MRVLLLNPKAAYVLSRFMAACSHAGVDLSVLMPAQPPLTYTLMSFRHDNLDGVETIDVAAGDVEAMARALPRFDAVVPSGEYSVVFGERLAARMGLFHNPLEQVPAYRDKHLMRQCFAEAGVPQPRVLARFADMAEVEAFDWPSVRFPVIVKPVDLSSSFYVRLCRDAASAKQVYRRIFMHSQSFAGMAFSAQGLLEEVAEGPEFSAECVVHDGKLAALFLTRKFLSDYPSCDEVGHLSGVPFESEAMRAQVHDAAARIVRAWHLTSGVMHMEFKWHDGQLRVIEAACRIGGDMISTLTEMRHGVALEECLVRLRAGLDLAPAFRHHKPETGAPDAGPGGSWQYGIKYLFSENLALPLDPAIELLESVRHTKTDSGPGGYGVENRLGHRLVRSRSPAVLRAHLAALGSSATLPAAAVVSV